MRRMVCALIVLVLAAAVADGGPLRNRMQQRRAGSSYQSLTACGQSSSTAQCGQGFGFSAPAACGQSGAQAGGCGAKALVGYDAAGQPLFADVCTGKADGSILICSGGVTTILAPPTGNGQLNYDGTTKKLFWFTAGSTKK